MRTTVDLPDALLMQAKARAALHGISLRQFFVEAIGKAVAPEKPKVRARRQQSPVREIQGSAC